LPHSLTIIYSVLINLNISQTSCGEAKEACLFFPAKKFLHWGFPDPADSKGTEDDILKVFREVRDFIKERILSAVENRKI
jgi:arsenate reductase